jgi:hypothetical protein
VADGELLIRFPDAEPDLANRYAQELASHLTHLGVPDVSRRRENSEAQDFGATLVLVLGTASVTAIAQGLAAWVKRHGIKVQLSKPDGTVVSISNADSADIASIVQAIHLAPRS